MRQTNSIGISLILAAHAASLGAAPLITTQREILVGSTYSACLTSGDGLALARPFLNDVHDSIFFTSAGFLSNDFVHAITLTRDRSLISYLDGTGLRTGLRFANMDGRERDELLVWGGRRESLRFEDLGPTVGTDTLPPDLIEFELEGPAPDPQVYDFDGDGRPEVLYRPHGLRADQTAPVIRRDLLIHYYTREVPESLGAYIGDYDGDGRYESFREDADPARWRVHRIGGDLTLSAPLARIPALTDEAWRAVGDVDGDGRDDLVSWSSDGGVTVRRGQRDATLAAPLGLLSVPRPMDGPGTFRPLLLADLDGRRGAELVLDDGAALLVLALRDGSAEVVFESGWGGARSMRSMAVGDLDGDGANDLVRATADCVGEAGTTRVEAWFVEPERPAGGGGAVDLLLLLVLTAVPLGPAVLRRPQMPSNVRAAASISASCTSTRFAASASGT